MVWAAFGAIWALDEKVSFDGPAKQIRVNSDATVLDVKTDLYSAWKRWVQIDDHAKFLPAFRTIGGDPVGGGLFAGDIYFLMNGWQIVVDHQIQVVGTLYHDDSIPIYVLEALGGVTAQVSNLAYSVSTPAAEIPNVPTAEQVAAQVRVALAAELTRIIELAKIHGLVQGVPLEVTDSGRIAGDVIQSISSDETGTTVTRV